jgi:hypothetical protein
MRHDQTHRSGGDHEDAVSGERTKGEGMKYWEPLIPALLEAARKCYLDDHDPLSFSYVPSARRQCKRRHPVGVRWGGSVGPSGSRGCGPLAVLILALILLLTGCSSLFEPVDPPPSSDVYYGEHQTMPDPCDYSVGDRVYRSRNVRKDGSRNWYVVPAKAEWNIPAEYELIWYTSPHCPGGAPFPLPSPKKDGQGAEHMPDGFVLYRVMEVCR